MRKIVEVVHIIIFWVAFIYVLFATYGCYNQERWGSMIWFGLFSLIGCYSIFWTIKDRLKKDE